jgi:hypothetical protein
VERSCSLPALSQPIFIQRERTYSCECGETDTRFVSAGQ